MTLRPRHSESSADVVASLRDESEALRRVWRTANEWAIPVVEPPDDRLLGHFDDGLSRICPTTVFLPVASIANTFMHHATHSRQILTVLLCTIRLGADTLQNDQASSPRVTSLMLNHSTMSQLGRAGRCAAVLDAEEREASRDHGALSNPGRLADRNLNFVRRYRGRFGICRAMRTRLSTERLLAQSPLVLACLLDSSTLAPGGLFPDPVNKALVTTANGTSV